MILQAGAANPVSQWTHMRRFAAHPGLVCSDSPHPPGAMRIRLWKSPDPSRYPRRMTVLRFGVLRTLAVLSWASILLAATDVRAAEWMVVDPGQGAVPLAGSSATELSGLTWLGDNAFLAVSDNGGPMFPLTIEVDTADGTVISAYIATGIPLAGIDLEGIAFQPGSGRVFVSDESGPQIRIHEADTGTLVGSVAVPAVFANVRSNLSLEALAWDKTGQFLWTGNEEALSVDGPVSSLVAGTTVRLQRFDATLQPAGQWAYVTEPLPGDIGAPGRDVELSGLPELIVLPDGEVLALERAVGAGAAIRHRLFQIDVSAATDTSTIPSLSGTTFVPVTKTLLWQRDVLLTNLEGATVGPTLADGAFSLLLVSDNGSNLNQALYPLAVRPRVCGDGVVGSPEECDDGNRTSGDGCDANCVAEYCGDGIVNGGTERCDDGNATSGDGCDEDCALERGVLKCQEALAKAGRAYAEGRMKAMQKCRNQLNKGKTLFLADDPATAIQTADECSREDRTVSSLERNASKARATIERKCDDTTAGLLSACAPTVEGLVAADLVSGCLLETHAPAVDGFVDDQYGATIASDTGELRKCQESIGKGSLKLFSARLRALQGCRNQFNRGRSLYLDKEKQQPLATVDECPAEYRAAKKLVRAGEQLRKAVARRCEDTTIATLAGTCATNLDGLVAADGADGCLVDGALLAVDALLDAEF